MWHFNDATHTTTTVASTQEYSLPTDFVRVEGPTVKYDNTILTRREYADLFSSYQDLTTEGNPSTYYLRGDNIGLFQVPNAAKTLKFLYRKQLTAMSADTDDSGMPSNFDEAIVAYAEHLCWGDLNGKEGSAQRAFEKYQSAIDALNAQYLGRRDDANFSFGFDTISSW
jgi:hypothetical protein